jgi:hypothetical protein
MQSVGATPQTYIVAQNPLVLAHLLRENQSRPIDPQAYTTPASVFNTLAVNFAEKNLEDDPKYVENILSNPDPNTSTNIALQTCPIQMKELKKLDPFIPSSNINTQSTGTHPQPDEQAPSDVSSVKTIIFPSDPNNSVSSTSSGTLSRDTMAFSSDTKKTLEICRKI